MSMRGRFLWVGGVVGGCAWAGDGEAGAPPVEGVEPGVVESGGRVMLMSVLPSWATGGGAGCCAGAAAGAVGSYSLMVEARRWKSEGGASEPRCGGSAYKSSSVG
jgi:hypothetical protein